jgi:hypothetical protein
MIVTAPGSSSSSTSAFGSSSYSSSSSSSTTGWTSGPMTTTAPEMDASAVAMPAPQPQWQAQSAYQGSYLATGSQTSVQPGFAVASAPATCTPQMVVQRIPCDGQWVLAQPEPAAAPPPMVYQPAPAPAPVQMAMAPAAAGPIPLSFFVGGISNGVGFNTQQTYSYGGGGFIIGGGGGTRFSGVRERSPTPLIPPRRPQPHQPPPHHCGHCH